MGEEKPRIADVMRDVEKLMVQLDSTVSRLQKAVTSQIAVEKLERTGD